LRAVGKSLAGLCARAAAFLAIGAGAVAAPASPMASAIDLQTERTSVEHWRADRLAELTGETGWLNLAALFWLDQGTNTFGRAAANKLVLDHPSLAPMAGSFVLAGGQVRFTATPDSGITHAGRPVTTIDLASDAQESPTVISSGPLRFFVIERAGKLGVRVRDVQSPRRRNFLGLDYFPIATTWVLAARFEPYEPRRHLKIVNILGLEEAMESPGAVVFTKDGKEYRLDAVLDGPEADDLFILFADATSGHDTYGAGRFLHIPFAQNGTTVIDFNKAYNPPCAFNDFATCPLPPYQNRLPLKVTAGERKYAGSH
jgi:uncharacterized protein (DUF1684 family)